MVTGRTSLRTPDMQQELNHRRNPSELALDRHVDLRRWPAPRPEL
jgi:hypothetical protein